MSSSWERSARFYLCRCDTRCTFENCVNLAYFKQITRQFGLTDSSTLIYENGEQTYGLSLGELLDPAPTADSRQHQRTLDLRAASGPFPPQGLCRY